MNNNLRVGKCVVIFCMLLTFVFLPNNVNANSYDFTVQEQTSEFYVNDFAQVFTPEQKQEMLEKAKNLDTSHNGIQVVVTTVNSLEDHEIENYAYAMYNQYRYRKRFNGNINTSFCIR